MANELQPSEELLQAADVHGPDDTMPAYARAAFPLVALPRVLRGFVGGASFAIGVTPESVATPAMATCASAIGNTCRIRLNETWTEPSVLWAVTLLESGSLKTPAYNAAVEPLRDAQRRSEEKYEEEYATYKKAKAAFDNPVTVFSPEGGAEGGPPVEPREPKATDLYTSDATVEAIGLMFANNPRGLALTRDELSGFFTSFGAYKGGRGGDEAAYLEFYNAGSVKLNRASGKRIFVHAAALSIFGTCQPAVFMNLISGGGKGNQVDNGMAARFVIAAPEMKAKRWQEPKDYDATHYHTMVRNLLEIPVQYDAEGRVQAATVGLTPEAHDRFAKFVNEHGTQTAKIGNPALRFHYAKLEAVAARLALIFYLSDCASGDIVGGNGVGLCQVLAGIAVARWYGREALRVYDGYQSEAEREKREVLDEIRAHGGIITIAEMRRVRRRWATCSSSSNSAIGFCMAASWKRIPANTMGHRSHVRRGSLAIHKARRGICYLGG